jgi:oligoendopeptidase F
MRIVDCFSASDVAVPHPPARTRNRVEIPDRFKWNLDDIFRDWEQWEEAYQILDQGIERIASFKGTLAQGPDRLLEYLRIGDQLGPLQYRLYYYPALA